MVNDKILGVGRDVLNLEANVLSELADSLSSSFGEAVELILQSKGHVVVCGMGKSGIVGQKISATLCSTGTPSFFLHPGEAFHGDLGRITRGDVVLFLSNSGETEEVVRLISFVEAAGADTIAITASSSSTLGRAADVHITVAVSREACRLNLAPTSSTTAVMAVGDALAVALMEGRGFEPEDFARFHPGGALGQRLLSVVDDLLIPVQDLPMVDPSAGMLDAIGLMVDAGCNVCLVGDSGLITDGDVRRAIDNYGSEFASVSAEVVMTKEPLKIRRGCRMEDALNVMDREAVTCLLVVDDNAVLGVIQK